MSIFSPTTKTKKRMREAAAAADPSSPRRSPEALNQVRSVRVCPPCKEYTECFTSEPFSRMPELHIRKITETLSCDVGL